METGFRRYALAAGAAALLSAQAAYAAPTPRAQAVDPLVALSIFGTAQSSANVCAAGTAAAGAAATAAQGAAGCVLPVNAPPPPAPVVSEVIPPPPPPAPAFSPLLGLLGALGVIALAAALAASGGGDSSGDLTPVSPA